MKSVVFAAILAIVLGAGAGGATAQENMSDPLSRMIWNMFHMRQGKTLCLVEETPLSTMRANVSNHLRAMGFSSDAPTEAVATALWTLYPCPFSPFRPELRPATAADIEGAWLFPESSQKLRSGLSAMRQNPVPKCDALGYYHNGELRHDVIRGQAPCPFQTEEDFESSHARPRVYNWAWMHEGRIKVTRTDVANHLEEWDVFAVFAPFEVEGVQFQAGDLVAYGRRDKNNEVNAATQFRHLQRLP